MHLPTHFIHILSSLSFELVTSFISFQTMLIECENGPVTSLSVTSVEQRPKEQIVSSRGLPEVQQREPGIPAGGPNTGAGGEAGRGGKVRPGPQVGSGDEGHRDGARSRGRRGRWFVRLSWQPGGHFRASDKSLEVDTDVLLSKVWPFLAVMTSHRGSASEINLELPDLLWQNQACVLAESAHKSKDRADMMIDEECHAFCVLKGTCEPAAG